MTLPLSTRLAMMAPSGITITSSPGKTLPLRGLSIEAHRQAIRNADLLDELFQILSPEFPMSPLNAQGATGGAAGTSNGVNAILEAQIMTLQQTNEGLAQVIGSMREYLEGAQ